MFVSNLLETTAKSQAQLTDEDVHGVSSRTYDHAQHYENRTNDGNITSTDEIGKTAHEGTYGS